MEAGVNGKEFQCRLRRGCIVRHAAIVQHHIHRAGVDVSKRHPASVFGEKRHSGCFGEQRFEQALPEPTHGKRSVVEVVRQVSPDIGRPPHIVASLGKRMVPRHKTV